MTSVFLSDAIAKIKDDLGSNRDFCKKICVVSPERQLILLEKACV